MQTVERECVYRRERERERKKENGQSAITFKLPIEKLCTINFDIIIFLHIINDKIID